MYKKPKQSMPRAFIVTALSSVGIMLTGSPALAANYSWDQGLTPLTPSGGTGTWDLATANWSNGSNDAVWTDLTGITDVATFGGTAGTVTVGTNLGAKGLVFTTPGYTLATGTNILTLGSDGIDASALSSGTTTITGLVALTSNQSWSLGSGASLTSSAVVSGTGFGITKTGAGTLTLAGANTYTGGTTVTEGTLLLGNAAGAGAGMVTLNGGTFGTSLGFATIANNIVAATGTTSMIGGTGSAFMIYNGLLSGNGSLQISNSTFGILNTNQSNYTGAISVGGTGRLAIATAANNQDNTANLSKASVTLTSGGTIGFDSGGGTAKTGTFLLGSLSSDVGVGSIGNAGAIKTAAFQIGFLNTDTTFGGAVGIAAIGNLTKVGTGTLTLNGAATSNLMAGGITIRGGTLQLGDGSATAGGFSSASNTLTFGDSGRFNYQGASTGSSQGMATTTFTTGAGTVQSTYGTSGNTSLTLANVAARAAGATGNFVVSGGANGSTNKIVFTQVAAATPATGALLDKGYYFNGADFAAYDTGGFVRALAYGTDTNAAAVDTITAGNHVKITATPSAQNSISLLTLNLAGSGVSWTNNAAQTLTISGGGLIKSGGGSATISGGSGLTTGGATEFVIRTDTAGDSLDIQTAILNTSTSGLTKTGAGTLTLSATGNAYTGATYVDEGTLKITGTANSGSGIVNVNNTGVFEVSGSGSFTTTGTMTVGQRSGNGTVNLSGGSLSVGALTISNSTVATDNAAGVVNVTGGVLNSTNDVTVGLGGTQTGKLVIDGGTVNVGTTALKWLKLGQYDTANGQIDINNGALNLNFLSDIKFNANTGSGTNVINQNGGTVTSYSGNGTGTAGSATDGAIDMQTASNTLVNNTYNLNGGTLTINRVYSSQTNGTRTFNFNGGTLKAASSLAGTFFNLGTGNARANVRNGGAILDTNGFNVTIAQALVHSNIIGDNATDGGLTKNGTGTLTLSAANTYTGNTIVNSGALITSATGTFGSGNLIVASGASVTLGNLSALASTATLTFANTTTLNSINLNFTGTLTLSGVYDSVSATYLTAGSNYSASDLNLLIGTDIFAGSGLLTISSVPEPATFAALAGLIVFGVTFLRRRRTGI
jgi:autotransporter-associated beta strand protein